MRAGLASFLRKTPGVPLSLGLWFGTLATRTRLFRKTPGVPFSLGLWFGTLVTRMSLKREELVSGTFVLRQNSHENRVFALFCARFRDLSSQICLLTERLVVSLQIGLSQLFG
jgi:hypothetical protein